MCRLNKVKIVKLGNGLATRRKARVVRGVEPEY